MFKKLIPIAFLILLSCSENLHDSDKIKIATTIAPYKYLISQVAGNKFEIINSIPANSTPHHFEPTTKLIGDLSEVKYYLRTGKNMLFEEMWVKKLEGVNKKLHVFDLSKGIKYFENDPHIWLSPARLKIITKNIYEALIEISPDDKNYFQKNLKDFSDSLVFKTNEINSAFEKLESKKILVYHGSWSYYAEDFGLNQIVIEKGSKSPSPKELGAILNEAKTAGINVVFVDPQHGSASAEIIAGELNVPIDTLNPLAENVLQNLVDVKNKIVKYNK